MIETLKVAIVGIVLSDNVMEDCKVSIAVLVEATLYGRSVLLVEFISTQGWLMFDSVQ